MHLVDAHHCTDSAKFISVVFLCLSSMVRLELPHINVLSKVDLIQQYGNLGECCNWIYIICSFFTYLIFYQAFNLEFYTDVLDLRHLLDRLEAQEYGDVHEIDDGSDDDMGVTANEEDINRAPTAKFKLREKFRKMNEMLIEVIEDFSLVSFIPLQIEDGESLQRLVGAIDKSNGYVYSSMDLNQTASVDTEFQASRIAQFQEKYLPDVPVEDDLKHYMRKKH